MSTAARLQAHLSAAAEALEDGDAVVASRELALAEAACAASRAADERLDPAVVPALQALAARCEAAAHDARAGLVERLGAAGSARRAARAYRAP